MVNARGLLGWLVVLLLLAASCSSATPEDQLANDFCAVVEDYASQDEDARSVFDVEDEYERLELRGPAAASFFTRAAHIRRTNVGCFGTFIVPSFAHRVPVRGEPHTPRRPTNRPA